MIEPILIGTGVAAAIGAYLSPFCDLSKEPCKELRTEKGEFEPVIKTPRKKHGLILVGDTKEEKDKESDTNTSNLVYKTLSEHGYKEDNLYFLKNEEGLDKKLNCHVLPSSKKHLKETLNHLSKDISSEDMFFMYVLSHGNTTLRFFPLGQSNILLSKEEKIQEKELEEFLSDLHPDHSITYFNSCHSGGFAKRLGKRRNIAISTSKKSKITSGFLGPFLENKFGPYTTPFTLFFYSTLRGQMPNGEKIYEENKTIGGAFEYAALRQYYSTTDSRLGPICKNTPHLIYGKIDPNEVRL